MPRALTLAVAALTITLSGAALSVDLDSTPLHFADEATLDEQVNDLARTHGNEKAQALIINLGAYVSDYIHTHKDGRYDESRSRRDLVAEMETLYDQAVASLDGVTFRELEQRAADSIRRFESERNARSVSEIPRLEGQKRKLQRVAEIDQALELELREVTLRSDAFGYDEVVMRLELNNTSQYDFTRVTLTSDGAPQSPLHVLFTEHPLAGGERRAIEYRLAPDHVLSSTLIRDTTQQVSLTKTRAVSGEGETFDFTQRWDEQQQETLETLRQWAASAETTQ